jgi:hypothetical protein
MENVQNQVVFAKKGGKEMTVQYLSVEAVMGMENVIISQENVSVIQDF